MNHDVEMFAENGVVTGIALYGVLTRPLEGAPSLA